MSKKVVFLDRDGTINVDSHFVHHRDQWQWTPNAVDALQKLQSAGYTLAVVTNQGGIELDEYPEYTVDSVEELHMHMLGELEKSNVQIAHIAYCPHKQNCDCRKPQIGMVKQIEAAIGPIDFSSSWTIGDKITDVQLGKNAGTKTALIHSEYWKEEELTEQPDLIVDSLADAATKILT